MFSNVCVGETGRSSTFLPGIPCNLEISICLYFQFRSVATGEDLADTLEYCKFTSMAWTHDNKGFFYNVSK